MTFPAPRPHRRTLALGLALALAIALPVLRGASAEDAAPAAGVQPKIADRIFPGEQRQAIEEIVKEYFIKNPEAFLEVQTALEAKMEKIQAEKMKGAIADNAKDIFHRANGPVAGNADGDVTVVEFFDYNCGYCKRSLPNVVKMLEQDSKVRLVFKDLPILSKGSEEASRIALAAGLQGKYWEMHRALFEARGQVNEASSLKIAEKLGLDMTRLKSDMDSNPVKDEILKTKELAAKMGISGTPHFLVGDRSIAGAPENLVEVLANNVAEVRKAGCKVC